MDGHRFDDLTRALAKRANRRGFLAGVAGLFGGAVAATGAAAACPAEQVAASGGRCVCRTSGRPPGPRGCPCRPSQERCPGGCVDTKTNSAHCGRCDLRCGPEAPFCVNGACAACRGDFDCAAGAPFCVAGVCVECRSTADCDDGLACTVEACVAGSCQVTPDHAACDDGLACTTNTCDPTNPGRDVRGCVTTTDDSLCPATGQQCKVNRCLAGQGCVAVDSVGAPCSDPNNRCVLRSECIAGGFCIAVETVPCQDDGNPCVINACSPGSGLCEARPRDGVPCDDGDPCTVGDVCRGGVCVRGEPKVCPAAQPICEGGNCTCVGNGLSCPDPDSAAGCCDGGCIRSAFGRFCCTPAGRPCQVDEQCCGRTCRTNDDFSRTCA